MQQCESLAAAFNERVLSTTGWVHQVHDVVYFNNVSGTYDAPLVQETWLRFDAEGSAVEGYGWSAAPDGGVQQEAVYLNGWYDGVYHNNFYNLENDFGPEGEIQRPHAIVDVKSDFTGGFCAAMAESETAGMSSVTYQDREAWQFSYEDKAGEDTLVRSIYFDRESGLLLGIEMNLAQPDGSFKIVSGTTNMVFELNAEPAVERFEQIWTRLPHRDGFVSIEQGNP